jgi:hypothetical protein
MPFVIIIVVDCRALGQRYMHADRKRNSHPDIPNHHHKAQQSRMKEGPCIANSNINFSSSSSSLHRKNFNGVQVTGQ